jgi:hypothetical protein
MPEIGTSGFDKRGWETERCRMAQAIAPILDSTETDMAAVSSDVCCCRQSRRHLLLTVFGFLPPIGSRHVRSSQCVPEMIRAPALHVVCTTDGEFK